MIPYLIETDGGKKRIIIGGFDHDINFVYFQLFEDKTFKLLNSGSFGGKFYRGSYVLRNDTLKINNNNLKNLYPSLTLILKKEGNDMVFFVPIEIEKSMFKLKIYKDFRLMK